MDSAKFEAFLDIARALNEIGITPPLCGSVGWEVVTGREWHPGDVDVHVPGDSRGWEAPDAERIHQLDEIKQWMAALGYAYTDAHEHAFESPDGLRVEMGDPDELPSFAGVALETSPWPRMPAPGMGHATSSSSSSTKKYSRSGEFI